MDGALMLETVAYGGTQSKRQFRSAGRMRWCHASRFAQLRPAEPRAHVRRQAGSGSLSAVILPSKQRHSLPLLSSKRLCQPGSRGIRN